MAGKEFLEHNQAIRGEVFNLSKSLCHLMVLFINDQDDFITGIHFLGLQFVALQKAQSLIP
ncbi:MAG TPA: hypothetical protein DEQ20_03955 [Desulfobulbaceae bacterium]|nr:MAG: hypothetical protein A2520_06020 [Deltaproteobacteria bacterium RIFOXYD12_FULL_53_23]HCC54067.1 hypothetical protein [Desulfobulbaceae bacterium]